MEADENALTEAELVEIVRKVGPPRGPNGKILLDLARIRTMKGLGFSKQQIAKYLGVSKATITRRLREKATVDREGVNREDLHRLGWGSMKGSASK